jgi:hypothetical protein
MIPPIERKLYCFAFLGGHQLQRGAPRIPVLRKRTRLIQILIN